MPAPKGNQNAKGRTILEGQIAHRRLTRARLEEIMHKYMDMDISALRSVLANPGLTPMIELMVISIMAKAATNGDTYRLQFLLDRLIGKVPDKIEMRTQDVTDEEKIKAMADELLRVARKP